MSDNQDPCGNCGDRLLVIIADPMHPREQRTVPCPFCEPDDAAAAALAIRHECGQERIA